MTATEVAQRLLNGKASASLTAKQARWLRATLRRQTEEEQPDDKMAFFDHYVLDRCTPAGAARLFDKDAVEIVVDGQRLVNEPDLHVKDLAEFVATVRQLEAKGLKQPDDFEADIQGLFLRPVTMEAAKKMQRC